MDGAQIRVLEQVHHERLRGLLQRLNGLRLPAQGLTVDGEEGEADFADLWGRVVLEGGERRDGGGGGRGGAYES